MLFKRKQQKRLNQRSGHCFSLSTQRDGLILQIEQKKAIIMAQLVQIMLKKMELCHSISLKKYPRSEGKEVVEKQKCLDFFRSRQAEVYNLIEGRQMPGPELLRRIGAVLQSVRQFEANLWTHVPTL